MHMYKSLVDQYLDPFGPWLQQTLVHVGLKQGKHFPKLPCAGRWLPGNLFCKPCGGQSGQVLKCPQGFFSVVLMKSTGLLLDNDDLFRSHTCSPSLTCLSFLAKLRGVRNFLPCFFFPILTIKQVQTSY